MSGIDLLGLEGAVAGAIVETIGQRLAIRRELGTSRVGEYIEALEINEQGCR